MIRLLCAAAAITLIAPTGAIAQRNHDRHDKNTNEVAASQPKHQTQRQSRHGNDRPATERQQNRRQSVQTTTTTRTDRLQGLRGQNRPMNRSTMVRTRTTTNVYRVGHRPATFHRIRASGFVYPRGYHYRHFGIGSILPRLFLSSSYLWNDWSSLGLLPPPPGYVWVRYGPDLLLVNRYNGRIADVIYGAFY